MRKGKKMEKIVKEWSLNQTKGKPMSKKNNE